MEFILFKQTNEFIYYSCVPKLDYCEETQFQFPQIIEYEGMIMKKVVHRSI